MDLLELAYEQMAAMVSWEMDPLKDALELSPVMSSRPSCRQKGGGRYLRVSNVAEEVWFRIGISERTAKYLAVCRKGGTVIEAEGSDDMVNRLVETFARWGAATE
jgi:hypothetical protein